MKKLIETIRAWRRGEEIEGEITLGLPELLLIVALIAVIIAGLLKCH